MNRIHNWELASVRRHIEMPKTIRPISVKFGIAHYIKSWWTSYWYSYGPICMEQK